MKLESKRTIPMWLAHPALPVGLGLLLFLALAAVEAFAPEPASPLPPGPLPAEDRLGPARPAGRLRTGPPPVPAARALREARQRAAECSRHGDFLGAARAYLALPRDVREHPAFGPDVAANVQRYLERASERLLFQIDRGQLRGEKAARALADLLALEGADRLGSSARLRAALEDLRNARGPGEAGADAENGR
ncbi:MAG: hypothetical protein D6731_05305 [Planctomycetota bacterium]|nr:MAG: hypothetical protein D6731_05305 [Planctomycetota bacterium]